MSAHTSHGPNRNNKRGHPAYRDTRYRAAREELKRTDQTCHTCGYPIDMQLTYPHPLSWSADHIIPKSQLTPSDHRLWHISNLQASHLYCNQSRGNTLPPTTPPPAPLPW
jgi:5-methylcytosine-specific restriction endonuclease McrA